jgi:hypothetical protein
MPLMLLEKKCEVNSGTITPKYLAAADAQALGEEVVLVIHGLGCFHDFLFGIGMQFGGIFECSGNSGNGDPQFPSDLFHRYLVAFFHGSCG